MDPVLVAFRLIRWAIDAYTWLIVASVLLSWFTISGQAHDSVHRVQALLHRLTEPCLGPIRQVLMPLTMRIRLDFSPIIALFLLRIIRELMPG